MTDVDYAALADVFDVAERLNLLGAVSGRVRRVGGVVTGDVFVAFVRRSVRHRNLSLFVQGSGFGVQS